MCRLHMGDSRLAWQLGGDMAWWRGMCMVICMERHGEPQVVLRWRCNMNSCLLILSPRWALVVCVPCLLVLIERYSHQGQAPAGQANSRLNQLHEFSSSHPQP